jgi:hypothetical protein
MAILREVIGPLGYQHRNLYLIDLEDMCLLSGAQKYIRIPLSTSLVTTLLSSVPMVLT